MVPWIATSSQEHEIRLMMEDIPPRPFPTYDTLSYDELLHNHLIPNTPFFLSPQTTSLWPLSRALRGPRLPSGASAPRLSALRRYGHHVVPVADTLRREFSEFKRDERVLAGVLDLWEGVRGAGEEGEAGEGGRVAQVAQVAQAAQAAQGQGEPGYDWLNPPFTPSPRSAPRADCPSTSDFRFAYLGPPLTYTPLHRDVYASYSWSANVVGRKVWWLFPPDDEDALARVRDASGELVFDVRAVGGGGRGGGGVAGVKVLQEEGEVIFIPSGWHHQVVNLDFCISINHNFFSSPSLPHIYRALCAAQQRVEAAIADVREMIVSRVGRKGARWEDEWVREVQALLEMDAGWGWEGFWRTVRGGLVAPPAAADLSPPVRMRNEFVRGVVAMYKERREWVFLPKVREVVEEVERLVVDI